MQSMLGAPDSWIGGFVEPYGTYAVRLEMIHGRHHGWIDLLAFDPRTGTLLIIELKTRFDDLGAIERQLGWYERSVQDLARGFGWRPRHVASWLVVLATDEVDAAVRANSEALGSAFPMRAAEMMLAAAGEMPPGRSSRGIALIDPSSRRSDWLLKSRSDGRRTAAPYRDYAEAARRLAA